MKRLGSSTARREFIRHVGKLRAQSERRRRAIDRSVKSDIHMLSGIAVPENLSGM
jgi:hypothetical protein